MRIARVALLSTLALCGCSGRWDSSPATRPPGSAREADTAALEAGARVLQDRTPVRQIDVYLNGFHVMKDDPSLHMEAHHYCSQRNEDLAQCVLFDANTRDANLIGIEYIVSEKLFETLPREERPYWHPHNYEILSGTLVGPGLPEVAETELMRKKVNSYGKTWHVWDTGHHGHPAAHDLPYGAPRLAWSYNADGEAPAAMVLERDRRMGVSTAGKRRERAGLAALARPQEGTESLAGKLPRTGRPAGVAAKPAAAGEARSPRTAPATPSVVR